jgi:uncharacterized membrane protein YphA (DoxX/SURF4 family)
LAYLMFASRCVLLVVFAASAAGKLRGASAFKAFRQATAALVPWARPVAAGLAAVVIAAELGIVLLLAIPATTRWGLVAAFALLTAFTVAIAAALRRGNTAPCRCFGRSDSPLRTRHLVRNGILLLVAATGGVMPGGGEPLGQALAGVAAVALALLVLNFDALADLFVGPPGPLRPKGNL